MTSLQKNNKFISLLIALLSFFILVFFTTSYYSEMQLNIDENESKKDSLISLNKKLNELNNLKNDLNDKDKQITKDLKKFSSEFKEDEVLLYVNEYIEKINISNWNVALSLENISFNEPVKSELWFREVWIELKIKSIDKNFLTSFIDYLVSSENKYSFFITKFSFPIEKSWPYSVNIPLKMYIK